MAPLFRADYETYGFFNVRYLPTNLYFNFIAFPYAALFGPDPGVNRSGRAVLSAGVCLLHAQFPSTRSAAMTANIDAALRVRAQRGASVDLHTVRHLPFVVS